MPVTLVILYWLAEETYLINICFHYTKPGKKIPHVRIDRNPLMRQSDIPQADRIMRLAFGTFLGLPDPLSFMGDAGYVKTRYMANPSAALVAEVNGKLAGSNFAMNWGSVGIFGPLTIHPDLWNKGVAKRLLEKTMELFDGWKIKHAGLFTFAQSIKHIHLYQNFGFWPRFLTSIM
jgi:GNAT superfamily N-acetyltransferase